MNALAQWINNLLSSVNVIDDFLYVLVCPTSGLSFANNWL